jgi:hypothetical protein
VEAFNELELFARQGFCVAGFDKGAFDPTIQRVFPGLSSSNVIYQRAQKKIRTNFRNWRYRTIDRARSWINNLVLTNQNLQLRTDYSFKSLRSKINSIYDIEWLGDVFGFAQGVIDFGQCSDLAKLLFRCKKPNL